MGGMRVPGAERARIDPVKIRDYLLCPSHPIGRFKAAFFSGLGYSPEDWRILERHLRELLMSAGAEDAGSGEYGRKYVTRGILEGPNGQSAEVLSVWVVLKGEDFPRLVTAYPGARR
jgi:hypothetical protein